MADRYDTTDNPEDEYYPGTSILINHEDIHDPISHQNLSFMLKTRHKKLQSKRKPEIKRSIIHKGK